MFAIYGAGAAGREAMEIANAIDPFQTHEFFDDDPSKMGVGKVRGGLASALSLCKKEPRRRSWVVAIGCRYMDARLRIATELLRSGATFGVLIHPSAIVSPFATIMHGCVVGAGCIVQAGVYLYGHVYLHAGVVIEHDVQIASCSYVGPNATICGSALIGERVLVGAGSVILPGRRVFSGSTIGAGAVLTRNILHEPMTVKGVPAR